MGADETGPTERFGSLAGWLISTVFTLAFLFVFIDLYAPRNHKIHPYAGYLGVITGGFSPLVAYASFHLVGERGSILRRLLAVLAGAILFFLFSFGGILLLDYLAPMSLPKLK
jgi:hypothetical protein